MRARITTSLGYSLLTAAALAGAIYANKAVNFSEIAQFVILGAGAVALLLMTHARSTK